MARDPLLEQKWMVEQNHHHSFDFQEALRVHIPGLHPHNLLGETESSIIFALCTSGWLGDGTGSMMGLLLSLKQNGSFNIFVTGRLLTNTTASDDSKIRKYV